MIQITFRIRREHAVGRATARFPRSRVVLWCNLETDLAEIHSPNAGEAAALAQAVAEGSTDVRTLPGPEGASRTVLMRCPTLKSRSVTRLVEEVGLILPPVRCQNGWEEFRALVIEAGRLPSLLQGLAELGRVELVKKTRLRETFAQDNFIVPATELLAGLSPKQCEAFVIAVRNGYYEVPRRASLSDIARRQARPRATLQEHLRKAEAKILNSVAPFVGLRLGRAPGKGPSP